MHWDRLFADLEGQLASEWEAERAALDAESERLRIAGISLGARLRILARDRAAAGISLIGSGRLRGRVDAVGADWLGLRSAEGARLSLVPFCAISGIDLDHGLLLGSLEKETGAEPSIRERMTLGFVLRDLARRRVPLRVGLRDGSELYGTADRAGADHLDIALHDAGEPRRARSVTAFRILPFAAISLITTEQNAL